MTKKYLHKLGISLAIIAILVVNTGFPEIITAEKLYEDTVGASIQTTAVDGDEEFPDLKPTIKFGNVHIQIIDVDRPDMPEGISRGVRGEVGIVDLDVEHLGFENYRIVSGDAMNMDIGGTTFKGEIVEDGGEQKTYIIKVTHKDNLESISPETPQDPKPEEPEIPENEEKPETEKPSDSAKRYVSMINQVVRHQPIDRASEVAFIKDGDTFELIDAHDLKWFKVKMNGQEGYVLRGNVTSEKNYQSGDTTLQDLTVTKKENQEEYIVAVKTPLRTGNADRYRPLKVMDRSDIVKYEGTTADGQWFKVDHKGTKGFVKRSDVTTKKNYEDGSPAVDLSTFSQMAKNQKLRTMIDSSIRTQAGHQYRVLDELPRNTTVIYKGTVKDNKNWFKVELNGEMGYVFRGDLTKVQ